MYMILHLVLHNHQYQIKLTHELEPQDQTQRRIGANWLMLYSFF